MVDFPPKDFQEKRVSESGSGFLEVTFDGGRFAMHSVPVSVLAELSTIQQLIMVVARHLFFHTHGERRRVPRGFLEAAQLHLAASEENCFKAVLRRPDAGAWRPPTLFDVKLFEQARDTAVAALAAAANDNALPRDFPADALDLLGAIGRQLNEDEGLLIRGGASPVVARVDQKSRETLARMAKQPLEREESIDGEVDQLDDASNRFWLRARGGERVEVPFKRHQRTALLQALHGRPIVRVRVRGRLVFAAQRKMKTVDELELVDHERAADVEKLWARIDSLASVGEGWLEGEGRAPTEGVLARAREVLARLLVEHRDIERPKVFPTPEGGLQAEWAIGSWAAEARFEPDDESIFLEATNGDTLEERHLHVPPGVVSAENAIPLADWLGALVTAGAARV